MNRDDCHQQELSIFVPAPSDTSLISREWIEYRPTNQITGSSVMEFNIPAQSAAYVDLRRSVINIKLRIMDSTDNTVGDQSVALINLPLHTIFKQVDVAFQQTPLTHTGADYPYKAYIDTILKTNRSVQENILASQLFYKDTGILDTTNYQGSNLGLYQRYRATKNGAIVDLEGPLLLDLFQQPKLLINGVSIGIKLYSSLNSFRLLSDTPIPNEKLQIVDARFKLCVQRVTAGVLLAHEKLLQEGPAIYHYLRSEIKTTSIASGQYSFSADDIFQGLVPSKLVVGLVASTAYIGDYKKNPFNFQHYDCSSVGLYVDGQSYPSQPLQPNYVGNQYVECYRTMATFRNDVNVSREEYKNGFCLYVMDIDPYYSFNTKRKGHCRLELKFANPLPESVTLIMYATFPEILNITAARGVYVK
jgi:hypothetical protein